VKAHARAAFLGYALWVTWKHLLKRGVPQATGNGTNGVQPVSASKALSLLSTLHSADIVLPTSEGREIRLRRITEPSAEQKWRQQFGFALPEHFQLNRKGSVDSAIA
jgi:hypothetical protein